MIPRDRFINFIRDKGYTYKDETDKSHIWRRSSDAHRIIMRRKGDFSEEWVRSTLRQAGISDAEIEAFVGGNNCH